LAEKALIDAQRISDGSRRMSLLKYVSLAVVLVIAPCTSLAQGAAKPIPSASTQSVGNALRALTPSGVVVGEVRKEGALFVFTGTAATNQMLSDFMRRAVQAPGAVNVELRSMAAEGGQYRYEMALMADCAVPGATKAGAVCGAPGKAQSVYKCRINGTLTFQAAPCPPGSET
jgi:hypothetical protein